MNLRSRGFIVPNRNRSSKNMLGTFARRLLRTGSVSSGSLILISMSVASSILGFVYWFAVSQFYLVSKVGEAAALLSAFGLIGLLTKLGFDITIVRYLPTEQDKTRLVNSCITVTAVIAGFVSIVSIALLTLSSRDIGKDPQLLTLSSLFVLTSIAGAGSSIQSTTFIAAKDYGGYFKQGISFMVLRIPFVAAFAWLGVQGILLGLLLSILVVQFFVTTAMLPKNIAGYTLRPALDLRRIRELVSFSISNYVASTASAGPAFLLPILVVLTNGTDAGAYFYVAWMLANVVLMIPSAISTALLAEISQKGQCWEKPFRETLTAMVAMVVPVAAALFIVAPVLLSLFGKQYGDNGADLLRILIIAAVASIPVTLFVSKARYDRTNRKIAVPYFGILITSVLLGIIMSEWYGAAGYALGWLTGNGLFAVLVTPEVVRIIRRCMRVA